MNRAYSTIEGFLLFLIVISINTFPLSKFISLYVDKELGELTVEQANELISQYQDAIAEDDRGKLETVATIEYLNSYIARTTILIELCETMHEERIIDCLNEALQDGNIRYKYQSDEIDLDELAHIKTILTRHKLTQKQLLDQHNKEQGKAVVISWDWYLDACLSMSQLFEYAVKIDDLTVKGFCLVYKRFVKQVEKLNSKTKK